MEDRVKSLEEKTNKIEVLFAQIAGDIKNIAKNLEKALNIEKIYIIQEEKTKVIESEIKEIKTNLSKVNEKIYIWTGIMTILAIIAPIILKKLF